MLVKLLKHDYRSMVFYFLLMYAVLIGIAVLARISIGLTGTDISAFGNDVFAGMTTVGSVVMYILGCGAVIVLTFIIVALRFYNNLMGREGYLSFTLPVTPEAHLASKMISGATFCVLSYVVIGISGVILTAGTGFWSGWVLRVTELLLNAVKLDNPVILILYVLNGLTALIEMVAIIYFSICVGQQASKYRILAAIGVYIGVHLVLGIITTLGSTILVNLFRNSTGTLLFYGVTNTVSIVYQCLVAAVCMAGAVGLMKNRLNLE